MTGTHVTWDEMREINEDKSRRQIDEIHKMLVRQGEAELKPNNAAYNMKETAKHDNDIGTEEDISGLSDALGNTLDGIKELGKHVKVYALLEAAAKLCGREGYQFFCDAFEKTLLNTLHTKEEREEIAKGLESIKMEVDDEIKNQLISMGWTPPSVN